MKGAIIGLGEVGTALLQILQKTHETFGWDPKSGIDINEGKPEGIEILHICFPYSEHFVDEVAKYQNLLNPKYTVIHSTVPIGTSRRCGAVHSPIRGIHPHLAEGIKIFVKFLGGEQASFVADYFRRAGLKVCLFDEPETTELGKLLDTEYYRHCIEFAKFAKSKCDTEGVNFHEAYTLFNQSYNEGYYSLGHAEFVRPILQPIMTEIGGHCVMQNKQLIEKS